MSCNPSNPAINSSVLFGLPNGGSFDVVIGTVVTVYAGTSPLEIKLTHSGGTTADHVKHSPCAASNRWGCESETCTIEGLQAWSKLSDMRLKRPV